MFLCHKLALCIRGDLSRKTSLVNYGFRLPSALDNRPLKFTEWEKLCPQTIFVSATPGKYELEKTQGLICEQIIRPTGLLDPHCIVSPAKNQVDDLLDRIKSVTSNNFRVLVTTVTKKTAEDLSDYLCNCNIKAAYLHSDIDTLERIEIINNLRTGVFDCLIGVNLLREGLDIPECALVAILDADKEGFLRNETSLIQIIGRAARNKDSKVILYADKETKSIKSALKETNRRRKKQEKHNKKYNIIPKTTVKSFISPLDKLYTKSNKSDIKRYKNEQEIDKDIQVLRKKMIDHATNLQFEKAANIRDEIKKLEKILYKFSI